MKCNLITISPYKRQTIQIETVFSTVSIETRYVKLRNKDLSVLKGKACLLLNQISNASTNKQGISRK